MSATSTKKYKGNRRKKWLIVTAVIVLLLAIGLFLVRQVAERRAAANQPQTGDVVTAFIGDLAASATASGKVETEQTAVISTSTPGVVTEVFVREGTFVSSGEPLVQINTTDLALQVERAQQNIALKEANLDSLLAEPEEYEVLSAQAAVNSAKVNLDELLAGPDQYEIAESEATLRQQQAGVASAAASYQSTIDSISEATTAAAEADLINAQIAYDQAVDENRKNTNGTTHEAMVDAAEKVAIAQAKVDELKAGVNQGRLNSGFADISAASSNFAEAQANYELLLSGSTSDQIAAAEATLAQAQANLVELLDGPPAQEIAIAEAELAQAKLSLIDAQETLRKATVKAPFDGEVTSITVTKGERATGEIAEIVSKELKIVLEVDEIDVGLLAPGQAAVVTLETWPEREISGEIASIAPSADNQANDIVTYDVQINLEEPDDLHILIGMTANARLITANSEDVLLVPNAAITADRQNGTYWVNLVTGEVDGSPVAEEVEVTIGLKDEDYTQVTSGLGEGDRVLVGELAAPTIQFGGFRDEE